jgi:hypothetical protein
MDIDGRRQPAANAAVQCADDDTGAAWVEVTAPTMKAVPYASYSAGFQEVRAGRRAV